MNRQHGFTLIELMIVVAIVAIIAAIAYPSYQAQILKTRRADAHSALTDISARLEKYIAPQNINSYPDKISDLGISASTEYYDISIAACASGTLASCYVITATPTGAQAKDDECASISLSSTGAKSAKNKSDTATDEACW